MGGNVQRLSDSVARIVLVRVANCHWTEGRIFGNPEDLDRLPQVCDKSVGRVSVFARFMWV
jgi:hypothetical protein